MREIGAKAIYYLMGAAIAGYLAMRGVALPTLIVTTVLFGLILVFLPERKSDDQSK